MKRVKCRRGVMVEFSCLTGVALMEDVFDRVMLVIGVVMATIAALTGIIVAAPKIREHWRASGRAFRQWRLGERCCLACQHGLVEHACLDFPATSDLICSKCQCRAIDMKAPQPFWMIRPTSEDPNMAWRNLLLGPPCDLRERALKTTYNVRSPRGLWHYRGRRRARREG